MKKGRVTTKRAKRRPEPYEAEISRGIRFLDRKRPAWLKQISLKHLAMNSPFDCILGQLWSEYYRAANKFGWTDYWKTGYKYGFATRPSMTGYRVLTQAWKRRITQLRKARAK